MFKLKIIMIAIFCIQSHATFAREKRNCPKDSEVVEILNRKGDDLHKVDELERLDSIKLRDSYLHIFIGVIEDDSYRIIIFDNQKKYLGFYDAGEFIPYKVNGDGDEMAHVIVMKNEDKKSGGTSINGIPIGNDGPWEKIRTESHMYNDGALLERTLIRTFTPADDYTYPTITTEMRKWTFRGGRVVNARLAMLTDIFLYAQTADGAIEALPRQFISTDDKKYIKSVKKAL